jgi:glutamine amidotransferase
MGDQATRVAIVDYDLGNLFSVLQACKVAGIDAEITDDPKKVAAASAVILPGVGGFPQAMATLKRKGLVSSIKDQVAAGRPLFGICLGQQLLMQSSAAYGATEGLSLIEGDVVRLPDVAGPNGRRLPIPHVGWGAITPSDAGAAWKDTPLGAAKPGAEFYFVHSYHVRPRHAEDVLALADFGHVKYCAAVRRGMVFGFQFHPERSGSVGLEFYRQMKRIIGQARR